MRGDGVGGEGGRGELTFSLFVESSALFKLAFPCITAPATYSAATKNKSWYHREVFFFFFFCRYLVQTFASLAARLPQPTKPSQVALHGKRGFSFFLILSFLWRGWIIYWLHARIHQALLEREGKCISDHVSEINLLFTPFPSLPFPLPLPSLPALQSLSVRSGIDLLVPANLRCSWWCFLNTGIPTRLLYTHRCI